MKKLLLFVATIVVSSATFAQSSLNINSDNNQPLLQNVNTRATSGSATVISQSNTLGKSSGFSDTLRFETNAQYDSLFIPGGNLYWLSTVGPLDSGLIFGTNALGFTGFANWYGWGGFQPDTTMRILGIRAMFGGTYQSSSQKNINFKVWGVDTNQVTISTTRKLRDLPKTTNVLGTIGPRSIKTIGIGNGTAPDTLKNYYFNTPVSPVTQNFYVGYDIAYQWANVAGDSIGVYSNTIGQGWGNGQYYTSGPDTIIFAQSAINDGTAWKDAFMNYGLDVNFSIIPIFQYEGAAIWPSDVKGITRNHLKLYGNFPNPAGNATNIQIALAKATTVTVEITDISGRTISVIPAKTYAAGEQTIPVATSELASGNYVYVITTGEGDALAAQFTVAK